LFDDQGRRLNLRQRADSEEIMNSEKAQRFEALKRVVEESDSGPGRLFDLFIQGLIVVSLVSFSFHTLPDLKPETRDLLHFFEIGCITIFTIEYALRLFVAKPKLRFVFSFFGIVDLAAILPFYVATGLDMRAVRALRMLRLFRILKLVRYSRAIKRFSRAFEIVREELILFFCVTVVLLYLSAVGIYYFENAAQPEKFASVFHSLWWSIITLTTVGYGDIYPITVGGRIFTFFVLMLGLGVVAVPTGLISTALSRAREEEGMGA
jgi:voltage-gated potassium channel